ncbi:tautomerase family protein [Janibacter sp. DB-40]|uniref:tautomerase family protein n=1 Tax=Janibacter sp. DB-40 TaxID=3028808 RepID=UPI0024060AB4|nr:tautomerase family protein [Janibacter sp. DB-40]
MPIVQVTLTEGRSPETIRSMISALTRAMVDTGVAPKDNVRVLVNEIPTEHFAAGDTTIAERHAGRTADNEKEDQS